MNQKCGLSKARFIVRHPFKEHFMQDTHSPSDASTKTLRAARSGSQASYAGPAEWFTGAVRVDPLFASPEPARASGAAVTFEPGARTDWHSHPLGQTLVVTAGCGRVQQWGGPVMDIHPGDVVSIPPGVKHWHGAAPTTAMTHIAIQEPLHGQSAEWMEKVDAVTYGLPQAGQ